MKRQALLLSIVACLPLAANAQTRGVERQRYLNGPVQSLRVEGGELVSLFGIGNSKPYVNSRQRQVDYLYDEKGNLKESKHYVGAGVSQTEIFKYDDRGRLVEESRYDSRDLLTERVAHRYDGLGKRSESLHHDAKGKLIERIGYRYDSAGRLVEKASYRDEKPNGKAVFSYDEAGRESSFIAYDGKGDIPNQIISQYDDKANTVQKARSSLKGDLEGTTVTTYDSKGNVTVIVHHRPDGSPVWKWEYEYDDKGNVIKEQFANKVSLSVWVYAYEYDSMGNWTRRTRSQLFDDKGKLTPYLSAVTYRTLKYFSETNAVLTITEPVDSGVVKDADLSLATSEIRPMKRGTALRMTNSPESLGRAVKSGTLEVEMTIDTEGNVESARVTSGAEVLSRGDGDVEQKIKKRKYMPVLLNGVPVKVIDTMTVKFGLPKPGRGKW